MKKTILLLLTSILCVVFFTGCPHETETKLPTEDNYPREIVFDKDTFYAQKKAWKDRGIKNYRFSQIFIKDRVLLCRITVKDNKETGRDFFWYDAVNEENTYNNPETFENYVTIVDFNLDEEQEYELRHQPNYIDYAFILGKDKVPVTSVDDIFAQINEWYEDACNKDFVAEKIAQYKIFVQYMDEYPVPNYFWRQIISEEMYGGVSLGTKFGWQDQIFDFEILDD